MMATKTTSHHQITPQWPWKTSFYNRQAFSLHLHISRPHLHVFCNTSWFQAHARQLLWIEGLGVDDGTPNHFPPWNLTTMAMETRFSNRQAFSLHSHISRPHLHEFCNTLWLQAHARQLLWIEGLGVDDGIPNHFPPSNLTPMAMEN